ncbi:MAG TPA: SPOR domain-containing protein [Chitinispirillaceae bacterium]|nr:SPOR domain-containing protein [Chitinispirillaceae bacterium]
MLRGKLLAGIILVVVIIGCTKKKVQSDTEFSQTAKKTVQSQSSTADIFEEFYKDDTSSAEPSSTSAPKEHGSTTRKAITSANTSDFSNNGRYVVQISTLGSRHLADKLMKQLEARGYPAYIAEVENPTPSLSGTYYRVRIGRFSQISSAKNFGDENLKPMGYEFWVDNKSNDNVGIQGNGFGESTPASNFNNSTNQNYQSYTPATYQPVSNQSNPDVSNPAASDQNSPAPAVNYPPPPSVTPAPSIPKEQPVEDPSNAAPPNTAPGGASAVPLDDEW